MEDEDMQEETIRRRKLPFSKEETLMILRAYQVNPSNWNAVINYIKANMSQLPNAHQQLYRVASQKQLKERVSNKFGRLIYSNINKIDDADIRTHVQRVRAMERRLVDAAPYQHQVATPPAAIASPARQVASSPTNRAVQRQPRAVITPAIQGAPPVEQAAIPGANQGVNQAAQDTLQRNRPQNHRERILNDMSDSDVDGRGNVIRNRGDAAAA